MHKLIRSAVGFCFPLACIPLAGFAQLSPANPEAPGSQKEETVILPAFTVNVGATSRYQADEATSAARVRTNLFNSSSTISVLTPEFLRDTGPSKVLDALKYVPGIAESTQPVGGDRMAIRGFQTDGQIMDGFVRSGPYNHLEPYLINSVEIVKGPNAILNPSGQPGGTVNYVSKKADFHNHGEVIMQLGQYDANKVMLDVNRVLNKNVALRVVGAAVHDQGYYDNPNRSYNLMPSLTMRWGQTQSLTLQAIIQKTDRTFVGGVPISPSASPANITTALWPGITGDRKVYADANNPRDERGQHYQLLYSGRINDRLSVRVAGHFLNEGHDAIQYSNNSANVDGKPVLTAAYINPYTGIFDPTQFWGGAPGFISTPAPTPSNIFNRGSFSDFTTTKQYDFQNDYAYEIKGERYTSTTTVGYSWVKNVADYKNGNFTIPAYNILDPLVYVQPVDNGVSNLGKRKTSVTQLYFAENISLFADRVILTGGVSNNEYSSRVASVSKNGVKSVKQTELFPSYGIVVKPTDDLSLYYGHSESAAMNPPDVGSTNPLLQIGQQWEAGIRYRFLNKKATITAGYFDVSQSNVSVPNPANLLFPAPVPPLPGILSDRTAKGWEFSLNMEVSEQLSIVANYTNFRNRDVNGSPIRGTAEKSGAIWAKYTAPKTSGWAGFGAGLGISHSGLRAGDTQTGFAQASVIAGKPVIKLPTFYLPSYVRADLALSYRVDERWSVYAMVENLLDKNYLAGSLNRNSVVVGIPRNIKASVTYSF
jgi:iron complex outermembrane receptor protein